MREGTVRADDASPSDIRANGQCAATLMLIGVILRGCDLIAARLEMPQYVGVGDPCSTTHIVAALMATE